MKRKAKLKPKAVSFTLEELAKKLGGRFRGEASLRLTGIAPLTTAGSGHLTFVTHKKYLHLIGSTQASAILCGEEIPDIRQALLIVRNPYADLARLIGLFHPATVRAPGIRKGALVDPKARVHPKACVFPGAVVCARAQVGSGTVLYPGSFVGEGAVIGKDCVLYPNAVVGELCVLGDRVILQPSAVIGADGFGFAKDGDEYLKIPQIGNVILEDDVEIGSCTCVDRAVLGSTRVGRGTKLDNLIQIAHNCVLGAHGVMAGQSGIAGSTVVGDHFAFGAQVGISGHLKIGDRVTLATRSGVMEDMPDPGVFWGAPAVPFAREMKKVAAYRELPELVKRVRRLEKALEKLQGNGGTPH